ncbi:MAG: hypothetical protein QOK15_567 [Nocardioidaceae bacterium]|nr:hypothetical protein [Nocardioidaceae bacterium]
MKPPEAASTWTGTETPLLASYASRAAQIATEMRLILIG